MNRWIKISIALVIILSMFTGCSQTLPETTPPQARPEEASSPTPAAEPAQTEPAQLPSETPRTYDELELALQQMTLEEKVGQMFIIRPDALDLTQTPEQIKDPYAEGVTGLSSAMADVLYKYPVGGIALFGKNILTPQQMTGFIGELQNASGIPLFMSVD